MKKIKLMLMVLISGSLLFVGCGNYMLDLTSEQNALITEYAAGLLLKYDKNHKNKMLNELEIEKEQEKKRILEEEALKRAEKTAQKEAEQQGENQNKDGANGSVTVEQHIQDIDLANFLELDGFKIEYQSYEVVKSYPNNESEDLFFSMDATPGNDLVVLHFKISNITETPGVCDILTKQIRGNVSINGGEKRNVLVTMLPNDFSQFQAEVGADPSDTVLIVEMKSEEIEYIEKISLSLKYNGETMNGSLE